MIRTFVGLFVVSLFLSEKSQALSSVFSIGYGQGGAAWSDLTGSLGASSRAGSGFSAAGGVLWLVSPTRPHQFEAQLTLGYMFLSEGKAEKDYFSWSRVPVEALYFYHHTREDFRLGWGGTFHTRGQIKGNGAYQGATTDVLDSWGWVLSAEKVFNAENESEIENQTKKNEPSMAVGLRYTNIRYRTVRFDGEIDGSTWSLSFSSLYF